MGNTSICPICHSEFDDWGSKQDPVYEVSIKMDETWGICTDVENTDSILVCSKTCANKAYQGLSKAIKRIMANPITNRSKADDR